MCEGRAHSSDLGPESFVPTEGRTYFLVPIVRSEVGIPIPNEGLVHSKVCDSWLKLRRAGLADHSLPSRPALNTAFQISTSRLHVCTKWTAVSLHQLKFLTVLLTILLLFLWLLMNWLIELVVCMWRHQKNFSTVFCNQLKIWPLQPIDTLKIGYWTNYQRNSTVRSKSTAFCLCGNLIS